MFVVFEGIDGSGKTTLSNRAARALAEAGFRVQHVREGGTFASSVVQDIREFGRDARHLALTPRAELLLYVARDVQLLEEATLPALGTSDLVVADRFLYTAEVLARWGRGLPEGEVTPIVRAAAAGVAPDLVVLVDVDPHVARARRRVAKILTPDPRPGSRKGLGGVGMQHRLREGYRALAAADPGRWLVIDNTEADLDEVVTRLVDRLRRALRDGPRAAFEGPPLPTRPAAPAVATEEEAAEAFLAWVDRRAAGEPALAAYFLYGLAGPGVDERRARLAAAAPQVTAHGLRGMLDPLAWRLRRELLAVAPGHVARSLGGLAVAVEEGWAMRVELLARVPADVAASLDALDTDAAWTLREKLWAAAPGAVVASLKRLDTPRAWALRERWLEEIGGEDALAAYEAAKLACESVAGLDDPRAWATRKLAFEVAPIAAIDSLAGVLSDKAWKWRERWLERAPKVVMRTIDGLDDPRAWALREAVAPRCKEALDSMVGLDGPVAWRLREACADVWPSTAAKSLGSLTGTPRGRELVRRLLAAHPGNLSLLKHATAAALRARVAARAAAG